MNFNNYLKPSIDYILSIYFSIKAEFMLKLKNTTTCNITLLENRKLVRIRKFTKAFKEGQELTHSSFIGETLGRFVDSRF